MLVAAAGDIPDVRFFFASKVERTRETLSREINSDEISTLFRKISSAQLANLHVVSEELGVEIKKDRPSVVRCLSRQIHQENKDERRC